EIAALQVRRDLRPAEPLREDAQLRHRHLVVATDVDAAQQRDARFDSDDTRERHHGGDATCSGRRGGPRILRPGRYEPARRGSNRGMRAFVIVLGLLCAVGLINLLWRQSAAPAPTPDAGTAAPASEGASADAVPDALGKRIAV